MIIITMGQKKNPHAQALGRLGGKARAERLSDSEIAKIASKGGKARAEKLTAAERKQIAQMAVAARARKRLQARKGK
jgi:dihydrodipicolinate synthase/N-acetylneuraminate lyase